MTPDTHAAMLYRQVEICHHCRRVPAVSDVWCPCGARLLPTKKEAGASYSTGLASRAAQGLSDGKGSVPQSHTDNNARGAEVRLAQRPETT
jgi:hypothetical protein